VVVVGQSQLEALVIVPVPQRPGLCVP